MKPFADLTILIFVVSSVLSVALGLSISQVLAPLRQVRLVILSLVANFVVVPVIAVSLARAMSLSEPVAVGLTLLGTAAGAPFLPKIVEIAKGEVAFSVALMVLLMIGSLIYLPLVLPRLLPGVSVDSWRIARSLLVTMILPLGIGLCVKARRESLAVRLQPLMSRLSNLSLLIALVLIPSLNFQRLLEMVSTRAIPAAVLFVGVSFIAGYVLGGSVREARQVLGFGTGARNIPAAMLVGGQNFEDPNVTILVIVVALLSLFVLAPLALVIGRRSLSIRETPL